MSWGNIELFNLANLYMYISILRVPIQGQQRIEYYYYIRSLLDTDVLLGSKLKPNKAKVPTKSLERSTIYMYLFISNS